MKRLFLLLSAVACLSVAACQQPAKQAVADCKPDPAVAEAIARIRTTGVDKEHYLMRYDGERKVYYTALLQKQGYYSYQYLLENPDGTRRPLPSEGNFFQTENRYQALVYFKEVGGRTWHLAVYNQITLN